MIFADRADAGRRLAGRLEGIDPAATVIAGLARGGVPVAAEVADRVGAPLEVLVVRKVGAPHNPEYGIGAVGEGGHVVANPAAIEAVGLSREEFDRLAQEQAEEVERRVDAYRGGRPRHGFDGKTVVVVDDGLATGVSARVAVETARSLGAGRVLLAVPVGAAETVKALTAVVDEVICLEQPPDFRAVGSWYSNFSQVPDDEVVRLLGSGAAGA